MHLIEGPVGAGKSTFAFALARELGAPHLNLDAWMASLFLPDRPEGHTFEWYAERKDRLVARIFEVACEVVDAGHPVVLELGLVTRAARDAFYAKVDAGGYDLSIHVLDAPREVRRERVRRRNETRDATYSVTISDAVFERASNWWEPVADAECARYDVHFVDAARSSQS